MMLRLSAILYMTLFIPPSDDVGQPWQSVSFGLQARFEKHGYKLPQMVFWNLSASRIPGRKSTPVTFNESGTALVSGFR